MNIGISSFINSFLGATSGVDAANKIDSVSQVEVKDEPKEILAEGLSKTTSEAEIRISKQAGAPTTMFGEVEIADAASEAIEAQSAEAAQPEAVKAEAPAFETLETARAKNEHFIGDNEIDGNAKGLLSTLGEFGGVDIGDLNKLEAGKTLEKQAGKISEEQAKNLTEMLDSIKDPAKSGPYLAKLKANHDQKLQDQLKERDQRLQALEQANQAENQGANPDLIKAIKDENNRFAQKMMNEMARLKLWEESQKFKNSQIAAELAAIHDSIKLAASVQ